MKRAKRISALLLVGVLIAFAFCGCANKKEPGLVKIYDDTKAVTLSVFSSAGMPDNFWSEHYSPSGGTELSIVEYTSDYYESQGLSYREYVAQRLESNVDIDLYTIHAEDVIDFDAQGYLLDLSDTAAAAALSPDALRQSSYDGKVFSIPLSFTGFGFFWNVDLLKEHGLSVPL